MGASYGDSFPKTTSLLRAVTYVLRKASEAGKPLAINLSFGNTYGSHDGTSLVERFLDNASEIGRTVICVGSGNEGAAGGHAAGSFPEAASSPQRIELSVGAYQPALNVQLWKDFSDDFGIRLLSPGGERLVVDVDRPGKSSYLMENTEILLYVGDPSPYSVKQEIYFDFLPVESYVNQGVWTFELTPRKVVIGSYDFYLPSSNILKLRHHFLDDLVRCASVGLDSQLHVSTVVVACHFYPVLELAHHRTSLGAVGRNTLDSLVLIQFVAQAQCACQILHINA